MLTEPRPVWVRNGARALQCPKSLISAESLSLVEEFLIWKQLGQPGLREMSARQAQAFLLLGQELSAEAKCER
jgi:hypothetical protein